MKVDDIGKEFDATMVAGSVSIQCSESGKALKDETFGVDTRQPVTGWWMFQKKLSVRKPALVRLCSMLALKSWNCPSFQDYLNTQVNIVPTWSNCVGILNHCWP